MKYKYLFIIFFIPMLFLACKSKNVRTELQLNNSEVYVYNHVTENVVSIDEDIIKRDSSYTVDPNWMARVKEIVDWAYAEDMYVIINIHHDNCTEENFDSVLGFYPSEKYKDESIKYLTRIWEQICETFNEDYDEHLVFELMNEPRLKGHNHEWYFDTSCEECLEAMSVVEDFNQACLDIIRESGKNNANRLVVVPSLLASPDSALSNYFQLPEDSAKNALALSVHMYTPYDFAMGTPGGEKFLNSHKQTLDNYFMRLNSKYVSKGIPVIIGEMGATNKDNLEERARWFSYFIQHSRKYGITSFVWDNGSREPSKTESERYGYYNRSEKKWFFPLLMNIALKASGEDIQNPEVDSYINSKFDSSFVPKNRAQEIVYDMQFGWNLGNTLDATNWQELENAGLSTETGWGQPKTTEEMIKGLKSLGIKAIRIPISWHNHIES